jgi:hypothetical protein
MNGPSAEGPFLRGSGARSGQCRGGPGDQRVPSGRRVRVRTIDRGPGHSQELPDRGEGNRLLTRALNPHSITPSQAEVLRRLLQQHGILSLNGLGQLLVCESGTNPSRLVERAVCTGRLSPGCGRRRGAARRRPGASTRTGRARGLDGRRRPGADGGAAPGLLEPYSLGGRGRRSVTVSALRLQAVTARRPAGGGTCQAVRWVPYRGGGAGQVCAAAGSLRFRRAGRSCRP